ncbi:metal-dependent hydrolase [Mycobacterium sp. GA-1199]|uniref:metal-dependent hydrolase n=1 Tax=Mycobacterium sp. GA-1199 TaxID=1772287 RepID=UPI00074A31E2|nr:metal-dependent hydrolase [Mycobacterium sp. GA-1199]KUI45743.1 metal-dependent hydrolase [Mycobacterium sp. GA-1199]
MSNLKMRRVRFDLGGDDVPFNWNPQRPAFAMQCNLITFFAPGFEKFIVDATREAIPLMRDPRQAEEANAYLRQEAQHSAAHMSHFRALVRRWPGLQETMDEVIASYDRLTATKPLAWRLAYTAVIENTFTPYFKVFLDHEDKLFAPGDERVASLFLWHFVEEIEHRSSALMVYNAVHGDFLYRARTIGSVAVHLGEIAGIVSRGFQKHVPAADGGHYGRLLPDRMTPPSLLAAARAARQMTEPGQATYAGVPRKEMIAMLTGLVRSQGPNHDPTYENLPPFAERWCDRYDEEPKSAAHWYSVGMAGVGEPRR